MKFSADDGNLYDVVCVKDDDQTILWIEENKTLPNAEAIIAMAIQRQGVEDGMFVEVPHGIYKKGEIYKGRKYAESNET
jgi:hypothetical protein